jgi:radical SAM protein with 4Fe4S-binding SPASM domain
VLPHLSWVKFSVDAGSAETYARTHAVEPRVFERTLDSIAVAVETRHRRALPVKLGVQYLVLGEDYADLRAAIDVAERLRVDYFVIKPHSVHPQSLAPLDVGYSERMLREIEAIVAESADRDVPVIFRKAAMEQALRPRALYGHCYALPFAGYVSSAGDFYTCSVFLGDERFRAGNLYTDSFRDIIEGERRRQVVRFGRHELQLTAECRVNCRMARVNEYLEPLSRDPEHVNFI